MEIKHSWMNSVLEDLALYAEINGMDELRAKLVEARSIAGAEIDRLHLSAKNTLYEQAMTRVE